MQKKWIFLTGIVLCLLVAAVVYYNYHKPRTGVEGIAAAYTVTATDLYQAYATDEAAADKQYAGKVVSVKGTVADVQKNGTSVMVLLQGVENGGGINCLFSDSKETEWPSVGEEATVKGRCSGFLMDVNLVDAVLVK